MLSNSKKQQLARAVGGVCRRVSEVIDLLGASSARDVQPKKVPRVCFHDRYVLRDVFTSNMLIPFFLFAFGVFFVIKVSVCSIIVKRPVGSPICLLLASSFAATVI